ncbi:hypothetical protein M5D96_012290 [Drosophila gunungcola]|uniref:Uncharacterized protein n=1 Tax=Drosophila gunungcola TaxID=103775 RepID=A0A9P9YEA3_9MUSC|nr:hypothetical protein M5D96_012290 [Drosophila gunungcola]
MDIQQLTHHNNGNKPRQAQVAHWLMGPQVPPEVEVAVGVAVAVGMAVLKGSPLTQTCVYTVRRQSDPHPLMTLTRLTVPSILASLGQVERLWHNELRPARTTGQEARPGQTFGL